MSHHVHAGRLFRRLLAAVTGSISWIRTAAARLIDYQPLNGGVPASEKVGQEMWQLAAAFTPPRVGVLRTLARSTTKGVRP